MRWVLHLGLLDGRKGDGIVIGARMEEQLEGTLRIVKAGPLPREVVELVDRCWEEVRDEAPHYSPFGPKDGEVLRE
jgi:aflatoxin B1 aldehyde reductase